MTNSTKLSAADMLIIQSAVEVYNAGLKTREIMDNLPDYVNVRDFKEFQKNVDRLNKKLNKIAKEIKNNYKRKG